MNPWIKRPNFSFEHRNPGHWDVYTSDGRAFRVRGEPGAFRVIDEREPANRIADITTFRTVDSAVAFICAEMMAEPECVSS